MRARRFDVLTARFDLLGIYELHTNPNTNMKSKIARRIEHDT
jgi:hypothetical protein